MMVHDLLVLILLISFIGFSVFLIAERWWERRKRTKWAAPHIARFEELGFTVMPDALRAYASGNKKQILSLLEQLKRQLKRQHESH